MRRPEFNDLMNLITTGWVYLVVQLCGESSTLATLMGHGLALAKVAQTSVNGLLWGPLWELFGSFLGVFWDRFGWIFGVLLFLLVFFVYC